MKLLNATIFATIIASTQAACENRPKSLSAGRTYDQVKKNLRVSYWTAQKLYMGCKYHGGYTDWDNCRSYSDCEVRYGHLYIGRSCSICDGVCRQKCQSGGAPDPDGKSPWKLCSSGGGPCGMTG